MLDNLKRKLFLKNELKKIILIGLIKNQNIPLHNRYLALYNKSKLSRSSSIIQQKTRCTVTGRN